VRARKPRAENQSVWAIHEDLSTRLTPPSRKRTVFRGALMFGAAPPLQHERTRFQPRSPYAAAFEPETFNQRFLNRVVSSNELKTVTLVHAALEEQDGAIALHLNPNDPADHRIYAAAGLEGTQNVMMTSLDNYLKRSEEHRPVSLVKIDV